MSITELIQQMQTGDIVAKQRLFAESYHDLRAIASKLMRRERPAHTLGATGLLHEILAGPMQNLSNPFQNRTHFYATAALAMRRVLLDHGRKRKATKRTVTGRPHDATATYREDPTALDLIRALEELRRHDEKAAVVVDMKHFLGMTLEEIAAETGRPYRLIRDDWDFARRWLSRRLAG